MAMKRGKKTRRRDLVLGSDAYSPGEARPRIEIKGSDTLPKDVRIRAARAALLTKREKMLEQNRKGLGVPALDNLPDHIRRAAGLSGAMESARVKRAGYPPTIYGQRTYKSADEKPPTLPGYCSERCGQRATVGDLCAWHARMFNGC